MASGSAIKDECTDVRDGVQKLRNDVHKSDDVNQTDAFDVTDKKGTKNGHFKISRSRSLL